MKKIIFAIIALYFLFMSLVYGGVFRDYADPLDVTKYYFECLRGWEWFLTYPVLLGREKDLPRIRKEIFVYGIDKTESISLELKKISQNDANVIASLLSNCHRTVGADVELKKINHKWFISRVKYTYVP